FPHASARPRSLRAPRVASPPPRRGRRLGADPSQLLLERRLRAPLRHRHRTLWSFSSELFIGQLYLVRNLVFAGLFHVFGPDRRPFLWSMLLTHLVNVLLLARAIRGHHDWERAETARGVGTVRQAVAASPPGAVVRIENQIFLPAQFIPHFLPGRLPGWAGIFVTEFPDDTVDGRPLRFVVSADN